MKMPESLTVMAKPPVDFPADPQGDRLMELRAGVSSLPFLADHGFQDMVVLPGSFLVEAARAVHAELFGRGPTVLRRIGFDELVILQDDDVALTVRIRSIGDQWLSCAFYEAEPAEVAGSLDRRCFARLEIGREEVARDAEPAGLSIAEFRTGAAGVLTSKEFYRRLRQNGNQYGPHFQNLSAIWSTGNQLLGELKLPPLMRAGEFGLHPAVLDSATQLLAALSIDKRKTFVLRSVDRIELKNLDFPDTLWVRATVLDQAGNNENGFVGDVHVCDDSGEPYLSLFSVTFAFLDSLASAPKSSTKVCIASTFTAEPMEDSLRFWGEHFGANVQVRFAPYNQVFQELLAATSGFGQNSDGINAIVLSLEDWTEKSRSAITARMRESAGIALKGYRNCVLPNGLEIAHLNAYETDYVYREIFDDECYLRHGIRIENGDTVVDVGANIGLFSLFVMSRCENPKIFAFEPSPQVFELLQANCAAYGGTVRAFNCGVSDRTKTAQFTFYEKSSVFSGFYADESQDKEAVQTIVRNVLKNEAPDETDSLDGIVNDLTADRMKRRTCECRLMSVSDIIRVNGIARINLLKIDAEKSELDVIRGIDEEHWPLIDQIVIEIHDKTGESVRLVEKVLVRKGFRCAVVEESLLQDSGLFNVYASRREGGESAAAGAAAELRKRTEEFCAVLNSFTNRSAAPLFLAVAPSKIRSDHDNCRDTIFAEAERELQVRTGSLPNVRFIGSGSMLHGLPARDYYDSHSNQLGHIPYTPAGYAAIGTALFRAMFSFGIQPFKVIVLDCDNTLWKGVCGEDGPSGVQITEPYRRLQEFMVEQANAGMLLCLCSKNRAPDVFEVFDRREEMVLRRDHLAGWRINWDSKAENLRSLAAELGLGLDSFVFIDDNPVECAEVRDKCPEVVTLQLPFQGELFSSFLRSIWIFDHAMTTAEDRRRAQWYKENLERETIRGQGVSIEDFLENLELRIDVADASDEQLGRISQLTLRTNQFNFTTVRRTENEIRRLLTQENVRCLSTSVSDRFGDYGLVGAILYRDERDRYTVDTFLLSCRALGKGVEHRMLSELGAKAAREGKTAVELRYVPTERNQPALKFINGIGIGETGGREGETLLRLPAGELASLRYEPDSASQHSTDDHSTVRPKKAVPSGFAGNSLSERMQRIGDELNSIGLIVSAIEALQIRSAPAPSSPPAMPGTGIEAVLTSMWKKILGRPQIGIDDNFFDAGGTSLKAVLLIVAIKKELKKNLSITNIFECPTIRLLAARLEPRPGSRLDALDAGSAETRGRQRRYKVGRKKER